MVSAKPEAVAVTIYRDESGASAESLRERADDDSDTSGLALIRETRTVELPAGRTRIRFEGVADEIIPASAKLEGLPGRLVEQNFDYDLLDAASLVEKAVGGPVTIRRANPKTGKVSEVPATLLSGPDGLAVQTPDGIEALNCGAGPEGLVFDHAPEGLADKPTLSVVADAPEAGRYKLTLSYLAVRIDWSADYVARLSPDGKSLDLTGWLTISNRSGASFADAPTEVVAGRLARVDPDLPDISEAQVQPACWPMGRTSDWTLRAREAMAVGGELQKVPLAVSAFTAAPRDEATEIVVTAEKRTTQSALGDYKLYSLNEPTTVAARQTKQIRFLEERGVTFEKLYVLRVPDYVTEEDDSPTQVSVVLSFENKKQKGLGDPLPGGNVSIRQTQGGAAEAREYFLGEHGLRDVPVGEPFELEVGAANDVTATRTVVANTKVGSGDKARDQLSLRYALTNARPTPATFELRQSFSQTGFRIVSESRRHVLKNGADTWRVTIPANGTAELSYAFEVAE